MTAGEPAPCHPLPHRKSGALDNFKYIEISPALGREYPGLQLSSIIDDEEIVRDLAITGMMAVVSFDSVATHWTNFSISIRKRSSLL